MSRGTASMAVTRLVATRNGNSVGNTTLNHRSSPSPAPLKERDGCRRSPARKLSLIHIYMQAWEEKIYLKQEGIEEGREEGEKRVSLLTRQLLKARRYEDLERAAEDPAYRRELYREFGL